MLFESLGLEESFIRGDELNIDGLRVALALPPTDTSAVADSVAAPVAEANPDSSNIINPSGFKYALNQLRLENSRLAYRVKGSEDSTMQQINFEDLVADQLNFTVEDLYVGETEARLEVPRLTFVEAKSGFRLNELAMSAQVASPRGAMPEVKAELTELKTGHSALNGNARVALTLADNTAELMRSLAVQSRLDGAVGWAWPMRPTSPTRSTAYRRSKNCRPSSRGRWLSPRATATFRTWRFTSMINWHCAPRLRSKTCPPWIQQWPVLLTSMCRCPSFLPTWVFWINLFPPPLSNTFRPPTILTCCSPLRPRAT